MNRTKKNIIMIILAVLLLACMGFTMHSAAGSMFKDMPSLPGMQDGQFPSPPQDGSGSPQMPGDDTSSSDSSSDNSNGDWPEPPSGAPSGDPPSGEPPQMPGNDAGSSDSNGNNSSSNNSNSDWPEPPSGAPSGGPGGKLLIFSGLNRRTMRETFASRKRIAAFLIAAVLAAGAFTAGQAVLTTTAFASPGANFGQQMPGGPGEGENSEQNSVQATGATTVDGSEETLNETYTSTNADENAILVTNGGTLTSDGATITKESGDSSNTESSDFSGVNSGLLVQENSSATVKNATIKTSAKGANAVFATGENAKITISDSTIDTTGEASSRGLDATYGGTIEADNVTITTQGGSCAAMATDRGEGTVSASNSKLETNGAGSPVIYSTGDITLTDSEGTANGAQITVVEGKNSATIENSEVSCSGAGNRGDVDIAGVMIYQSMSGDADEGTGNFTAKDSELTISKDSNYYKTAPMFFVTNTDAVIDLQDTDLNFGSGVLLSAKGTTEWGSEGSNGGNVTLNADDQTLKGDIELDEISALDMTLTGSTYKGTINGDNTAKSVSLTLDKASKITLTGDSYVTSLEDADSSYSNIDFNGYTLYVDGKAVN